jgi:hypothetical protein
MSTVVILAIGVAITVALPLVSRRGRFDPFEPVAIFALAWGVMFVVRPIAIVIRDDTNFYGVDIGATLDEAVFLGLLGAVAFVVGYQRPLGARIARRLPPAPEQVDSRSALAWSVGAAATGVVALLLFLLPSGGVGAIGTFLGGRGAELDELLATSPMYLWWASLLVIPAALVAVAVAVAERRPSTALVAAVLLGIALVRTIPVGNRVYLLVLGGGIVVFLYLRVRSRPGLVVLVVAPLLALFVSKAVLDLRYAENRQNVATIVERFVATPSRAFRPILEGPDAEMAPALAGALSVVPDQLPHRYGGATFGDLLRRPIPRQLWAAKPPPPGQKVVELVWPEARETGGFDPAFTPLLFFYWDFGLLGVLVGLAAYGVLARMAYAYLRLYEGDLGVQIAYAAALWFLVVAVRQDPVSVVVEGTVVLLPIVAIFRLAAPGRRSRVADAPTP